MGQRVPHLEARVGLLNPHTLIPVHAGSLVSQSPGPLVCPKLAPQDSEVTRQ